LAGDDYKTSLLRKKRMAQLKRCRFVLVLSRTRGRGAGVVPASCCPEIGMELKAA